MGACQVDKEGGEGRLVRWREQPEQRLWKQENSEVRSWHCSFSTDEGQNFVQGSQSMWQRGSNERDRRKDSICLTEEFKFILDS